MSRQEFSDHLRMLATEYPFAGRIRPDSGELQDIASTILRWLKPPSKLLDFGAGACVVTGLLSMLGYECSACDDLADPWASVVNNQAKALGFARRRNIRFVACEREKPLPFAKGEFDALIMNDVLEHLHDSPKDLLIDLLSLVRPDGFLFVTVPNAVNLLKRARVLVGKTNMPPFDTYYWSAGSWRGHVREYTRNDLCQLGDFLNLEILELRGVHHHIHVIPRHLRPIWLGLTGLLKGTRDTWSLVAKKRADWSPEQRTKEEIERMFARAAHCRDDTGHAGSR